VPGEFLCGHDLYNAIYQFDLTNKNGGGVGVVDRFRLTFVVKGPAKNYRTVTDFVKI